MDVKAAFEMTKLRPSDRVHVKTLAEKIREVPDRKHAMNLSPHQLSTDLRKWFHIETEKNGFRVQGGPVAKGYRCSSFADAFKRYLAR
jgi:hypothetical protein